MVILQQYLECDCAFPKCCCFLLCYKVANARIPFRFPMSHWIDNYVGRHLYVSHSVRKSMTQFREIRALYKPKHESKESKCITSQHSGCSCLLTSGWKLKVLTPVFIWSIYTHLACSQRFSARRQPTAVHIHVCPIAEHFRPMTQAGTSLRPRAFLMPRFWRLLMAEQRPIMWWQHISLLTAEGAKRLAENRLR